GSGFVEEAGLCAGVARRPGRLHPQQHSVEVTVQSRLDDLHRVSGCRALFPQAAYARVEPRSTGFARLSPCLLVHVGQHQHLPRLSVLHHRWNQAVRKVGTHCLTSRPIPARPSLTWPIDSSPKWNTDAASAASAPPTGSAERMWSIEPAPPEAMTGRRTASLTARVSSMS